MGLPSWEGRRGDEVTYHDESWAAHLGLNRSPSCEGEGGGGTATAGVGGTGFNGAALMRERKGSIPKRYTALGSKLQRGRPDARAEGHQRAALDQAHLDASTGPTSREGGRTALRVARETVDFASTGPPSREGGRRGHRAG